MAKLNQIYKCNVCGHIIEVLHEGAGTLTCCEQAMQLITEKAKDEGLEKHLPVIKKLSAKVCKGGDGIIVQIGSTLHPMEDKHYIEWIEIKTIDNKVGKKFLKPGNEPKVEFHTRMQIIEVRAYCNIHGLWKLTV